jgi:hypothetical protein
MQLSQLMRALLKRLVAQKEARLREDAAPVGPRSQPLVGGRFDRDALHERDASFDRLRMK